MSASPDGLLARVRKLLAKAEDPACTPAEAEANVRNSEDPRFRFDPDELHTRYVDR